MKLFLLSLACLINIAMSADTSPRLLIKIPTRSRPKQFFNMLDLYYAKLSKKYPYRFLITCDANDTSMNNKSVIAKLQSYPHLTFSFSKNRSKIEAYNKDIDQLVNDFDILLLASDDMEPIAKYYDEIIIKAMLEYFPDFDGVLNFDDGHQLQTKINTYPVIGNAFYRRFGYAYFPSYKSFYCDEELKNISQMLGKEKICNEHLLYHHHPGWAKKPEKWDCLYETNQGDWSEDQALFFARSKQKFYLGNPA